MTRREMKAWLADCGEIVPDSVALVGTRSPTPNEVVRGKLLEPIAREYLDAWIVDDGSTWRITP